MRYHVVLVGLFNDLPSPKAMCFLSSSTACQVDDKWVKECADFGDGFETLSKDIADKIKEKIKCTLHIPRYKLVTQVTVGQMKDQGVRITSRCLWDTSTDNYATASFQNQHIWASAIVFGLYTD